MTLSLKITSHWEINEMCIDIAFKDKLGFQVFKGALETNHRNETPFILQGFTRSPWMSAVKICVRPWGLHATPEANVQAPQGQEQEEAASVRKALSVPLLMFRILHLPSLFFFCTKETI